MALSFDANYYMSQRPDVFLAYLRAAGSTGLSWVQFAQRHYDGYGRFESSNPNATFNTLEYLKANPDVAAAGINPFDHYLKFGVNEGRAPSDSFPSRASFDFATYIAANKDLGAAGIDNLQKAYAHFVVYGQFENRMGAPAVDTGIPGKSFALSVGIDSFTGTANNDTFTAAEIANGTVVTPTLTAGDTLNGGAGVDTLKILQSVAITGIPGGATISNIENISLAGGDTVTFDASSLSGVTSLVSTQSAKALSLTAATTTDVAVSGASDTIAVDGGKNITVTDSTIGKSITIGATTVGAGNVTVTDSKVGNASIAVDGGKDVTITATGSASSTITVGNGGAATDLPSGAVVVKSSSLADASDDAVLSTITVKGGSAVNISQVASSTAAAADATAATITQGAVTVVGGGATSSVTVTQTASKAAVSAVAASGANVTETASVKFAAMTKGETLISGGLTFTAAKDLTAAEVAQAFANLVDGKIPAVGDTQGSSAAANGVYKDAFSGWTSGAASGDTVVFTSTTNNSATPVFGAFTGTAAAKPVVTATEGSSATAAKAGVLGAVTGAVTINDAATASIKTITLDGYGETNIGVTTTLSKLENLSLANSGGASAGDKNAAVNVKSGAVSTLALAVNNVNGNVGFDVGLKTLNVTTSGANSEFALTANGVETLSVAGDKSASFKADLAALKNVTVSGSAGLSLMATVADTLESVNTSATTGAVSVTIDGSKATYTGGSGVDTVSLATATALTKAIDLGAGDDSLSFGTVEVRGSTAALSGGAGTDTISMSVAAANALDDSKQSFITNFERLTLNDQAKVAADVTLNLANLGFTNYVTTSGTDGAKSLILDKMANGGTVVLTGATTGSEGIKVNIADAATGTSDVLNVVLSSAGDLQAGKLTAANVETIIISTVDTDQVKNADALALIADKATSVNLSGSSDLKLDTSASTKVTSIDGSAMTGGLDVISANTTSATTIRGGSGNDKLSAATGTTADVLLGGSGDDTLTGNAGLSKLTGGAGNDVFVVNVASQNVNSYATITDFTAGDLIQFTGAKGLQAAKVSLGSTAVFQDYANSAVNSAKVGELTWFQFSGDTYVVMDNGNDSNSGFVNNEDFVVKVTGLVDLTNASFNDTYGTIGL